HPTGGLKRRAQEAGSRGMPASCVQGRSPSPRAREGGVTVAEVTAIRSPDVVRTYVEKALVEKDAGALPLVVSMAALERYREAGYTLMRTRSAGRVQSPDGWRLDFGIVDGAGVIHAGVRDVLKLPRAERRHLAAHVVTGPMNARDRKSTRLKSSHVKI